MAGEASYVNVGVGDADIFSTYDGAGARQYSAYGWCKYV